MRMTKLASGALIGGMLLMSAGAALAQTTGSPSNDANSSGATLNSSGTGTYYSNPATNSSTAGTPLNANGSTNSASVTSSSSSRGDTNSSSTAPGIPNTGAGGDAATNALILGVTAVVVIGGALYLIRQRQTAR